MELRNTDELATIAARVVVPVEKLSEAMGSTYGKIMEYLGLHGIQASGPPFAVYHNMDMTALDVEIGIPVPAPVEGSGDLTPGTIRGGRAAVGTHTGPYDTIGDTYGALTAFMEEKGLEMDSFSYEFYLNDPREVPPDELKTEIFFPIKE